ncbi:MBL fold metallo-hydrolase [soil metagenome]
MPSRRHFLEPTFPVAATSVLPTPEGKTSLLKADLNTSQMRDSGRLVKLTIQPLRDKVFLISGSGGNVLVHDGPDGKLIVDTGFATSRTQMSEAFASISPQPLRLLIDTHWHFDHTDGNDWIHAAGATIVSHRKTVTRMQHTQFIPEFEGVFPPRTKAALPTVTFERKKTLHFNRQTIELARYTPAHTDTDISVYLAEADVLHTGDASFNGLYPFIDYSSGGSIDGMIAACEENLVLAGPSTLIVCGHGTAGRRADILSFKEMLENVRHTVVKLKRAGASEEEVLSRKPTAQYDQEWGGGFISADLFTWLVYRGV